MNYHYFTSIFLSKICKVKALFQGNARRLRRTTVHGRPSNTRAKARLSGVCVFCSLYRSSVQQLVPVERQVVNSLNHVISILHQHGGMTSNPTQVAFLRNLERMVNRPLTQLPKLQASMPALRNVLSGLADARVLSTTALPQAPRQLASSLT